MTDQEKESFNKFLTEWMGEEFTPTLQYDHKGELKFVGNKPKDYFTWPGFGALWEKAKKDRLKFESFILKDHDWNFQPTAMGILKRFLDDLIDPQVFPKEWAKFLGFKP